MAHDKLKASPCFKEVHDKLEAGIAVEKVAAWAQDEGGCYKGIKLDSLVRAMYRYKKDAIPLTAQQIVASADQNGKPSLNVWGRIQGMQRGLNEMEELEKLYLLQLGRIHRGVTIEETINFLDRNVRREVELATEILGKMVDLKLRLGIYKEAAKDFNINAQVKTTHTEALEKMDPAARQQLGGVARNLIEALMKGAVNAQAPLQALPAGSGAAPAEEGDVQEADYEMVEA